MKRITLNRVLIAALLIYFPVAAVGESGSTMFGIHVLSALVFAVCLGFEEGSKE